MTSALRHRSSPAWPPPLLFLRVLATSGRVLLQRRHETEQGAGHDRDAEREREYASV